MSHMYNCRSRFSSCLLNGFIYVLGGMGETMYGGNKFLNAAERFDIKKYRQR